MSVLVEKETRLDRLNLNEGSELHHLLISTAYHSNFDAKAHFPRTNKETSGQLLAHGLVRKVFTGQYFSPVSSFLVFPIA